MLQIARIFLRSQPTPRPSPSQEGNSVGPSHTGIASIPFFRSEIILFSWCATRCDWRRRGVAPLSWSIGYGEETRRVQTRSEVSHPTLREAPKIDRFVKGHILHLSFYSSYYS
ncbi:hypothetical protein [Okeania sp. SIO2C2]|uniref:hypothetical protein n=1 Tax=Okeania sp. SIO2C2 TaxID=2607787 RepID=UPI00257B77E8|nr:hypothetical protein [Okeania sp. SIO2C2]